MPAESSQRETSGWRINSQVDVVRSRLQSIGDCFQQACGGSPADSSAADPARGHSTLIKGDSHGRRQRLIGKPDDNVVGCGGVFRLLANELDDLVRLVRRTIGKSQPIVFEVDREFLPRLGHEDSEFVELIGKLLRRVHEHMDAIGHLLAASAFSVLFISARPMSRMSHSVAGSLRLIASETSRLAIPEFELIEQGQVPLPARPRVPASVSSLGADWIIGRSATSPKSFRSAASSR